MIPYYTNNKPEILFFLSISCRHQASVMDVTTTDSANSIKMMSSIIKAMNMIILQIMYNIFVDII